MPRRMAGRGLSWVSTSCRWLAVHAPIVLSALLLVCVPCATTGRPAGTAATVVDFTKLNENLKPERVNNKIEPSPRFGVLLAAYSLQPPRLTKLLNQSVAAASRLRAMAPRVPIAVGMGDLSVLDNATRESFEQQVLHLADFVIRVPASHIPEGANIGWHGTTSQWLTRTLLISASPFSTTASIDSQAYFCDPSFEDILSQWAGDDDMDIG